MASGQRKILYIITKSDVGGAQKYVRDLSEHIGQGPSSTKILYGGTDIRWLTNKVYPLLLFANDWLAVFELARILRREEPNIIHLNSSKTGVVGALAGKLYNSFFKSTHAPLVKIVFTAHGWVFNPGNYISSLEKLFYRFLHRIAAKLQDMIICVSQYDYELALLYTIAPEHKLVTIHNGIDPDGVAFADRLSARETLAAHIPEFNREDLRRATWVGSIGRLSGEKDYGTLIAAAREMRNAYFLIIGAGMREKKLRERIQTAQLENRFFIISPTGHDAIYLKAFDVFVMTSIKEGLPYSLLEAMASGRAIVITKTGGMPEAIVNEETGFVIPKENPSALAHALRTLAHDTDMQERLGKAAREKLEADFTLKKMTNTTENIYAALGD